MKLVEIDEENFDVIIDLRYASKNNIIGEKIYQENKCFLLEKAAFMLKKAVKIAKDLGLIIKIFDAYRPPYVQEKLWNYDPNPKFLTDPSKGSPHSKGIAIDCTLTYPSGEDLDMGTDFDDFTELAFHLSNDISQECRLNRIKLLSIMTLAGFDHYLNEWWHYQLFNSSEYSLIKKF